MADKDTKRLSFGICLALTAGTLLLYWPITHHKFINFDDHAYIVENPHVLAGLTWPGVVWAFTSRFAGNWHPITWLSHMLDCQLYGLNAGDHHLTNLLFHIANSLLVFLLLRRMTGAMWRSALVAALFAWHPLHVESVAWASERKDVLSTFFGLLTLLAYAHYATSHRRSSYFLALFLFALGLMSKPMLVTLPCVFLLLDFWPLGRLRLPGLSGRPDGLAPGATNAAPKSAATPGAANSVFRLLLEKLPFFALTAAASVVTYLAQSAGGAVSSLEVIPLETRVANALLVYWRYVSKVFWPADLAIVYPYPQHLSIGLAVAAALLLAIWSGLIVLWAKRHPYSITGWFWYLGTLVPTIGLVQVGAQAMADRYMYIPSIGLFILVVWGLNDVLDRWQWKRNFLVGLGAASLAGCLVGTRVQLGYWQNSFLLFRHALAVTSDNYIAYDGLGKAFDDMGNYKEAVLLYEKSVRMDPHYPGAQYNLGTILLKMGRLDEAIQHLTAATKDTPRFADAQNNLGKAFLQQGKLDMACAHLSRAVELEPDDPEMHYNYGTALMAESKLPEAVIQLTEAVRLKPDYVDAQGNLAVALIQQGEGKKALIHFAAAARLQPDNPSAHFNFGLALLNQGQPAAAAAQFLKVIRLRPEDGAAHYRLAVALTRQQKTKEAVRQYREALRLRPEFPEALNELGWILSADPDPAVRDGKAAIQFAERACTLTGRKRADMLLTLANAYADTGRYADAIATAQQAHNLALKAGQKEVAARADTLEKSYQAGHPFRGTF